MQMLDGMNRILRTTDYHSSQHPALQGNRGRIPEEGVKTK
jgi:hypothetical protein